MKSRSRPRFSRSELAVLAVLFGATVIVATGIQMGNVLFPALSRLMDVPVGTATLLVSVWAFTGFLSPLFGPLSDRHGHGTFVLIGLGVFTLGNLLCVAAPSFPVLVVFQVIVGLGYAVFGFSATAVVGDVFAYETRARAMGIVRLAVSVTALAGVPAAAALGEWATPRASFGAVGGLGLIVLVVALALLPRRSQEAEETHTGEAEKDLWRSITGIARQRSATIGLLTVLGWAAIPTGVFIYLAAWLGQRFQLSEARVGLVFSMAGVGGLIGNALTASLADRLGKKRSSLLGLLLVSVTTILLSHSPMVAAVLIGFAILVAALEFGVASFGTLMTELVPGSRGTLMSLFALANGVGTGVVPVLMRPVWEREGYVMVTLVLGVLGLVTALMVGLFVTERQTATSSGQLASDPPA
jgi:DHA1 family inner membrane transport protein